MRRSSQQLKGFTLIEIIIVLFIMSLIVVSVVVNFAPRFGVENRATLLTHRLQQYTQLLQDQAIFRHQQYGFSLQSDQWHFYRWQTSCRPKADSSVSPLDCDTQGFWRTDNLDNLISVKKIDSRFRLQLFTERSDNNPQIVFQANGEVTPYTIEISDQRGKPYYRLQSNQSGSVQITDLGKVE